MAAEEPPLEGDTEKASLCPCRGSEKEFGGNVCSEIQHLRGRGAKKGLAFFTWVRVFPSCFQGGKKDFGSPSWVCLKRSSEQAGSPLEMGEKGQ